MSDSNPSRMSPEGVEELCGEESFVGHVYKDQVKRDSIGYGHLVRPGEDWRGGISEPHARELLALDLRTAERAVVSLVRTELTQGQFDALVSLVFNIGGPRFAGSHLVARLNAGDVGTYNGGNPRKLESYTGALREWAEFRMGEIDGVPTVLPVLVGRRAREIAKFLAAAPARMYGDPATAPDMRLDIVKARDDEPPRDEG